MVNIKYLGARQHHLHEAVIADQMFKFTDAECKQHTASQETAVQLTGNTSMPLYGMKTNMYNH